MTENFLKGDRGSEQEGAENNSIKQPRTQEQVDELKEELPFLSDLSLGDIEEYQFHEEKPGGLYDSYFFFKRLAKLHEVILLFYMTGEKYQNGLYINKEGVFSSESTDSNDYFLLGFIIFLRAAGFDFAGVDLKDEKNLMKKAKEILEKNKIKVHMITNQE